MSLGAAALGDWLDAEHAETLWAIDGEDDLADLIGVPAPGREVAAALRQRGGRIRVFASRERISRWEATKDLAHLAHDDGELTFFLAWEGHGDPKLASWALVRDVLAEQALAATG